LQYQNSPAAVQRKINDSPPKNGQKMSLGKLTTTCCKIATYDYGVQRGVSFFTGEKLKKLEAAAIKAHRAGETTEMETMSD